MMLRDIKLVEATPELAEQLAATMRPEDVAELAALRITPIEGLLESLRKSELAFAVLLAGELSAIFGVGQLEGVAVKVGHAWVLTGEPVARHRRAFMMASAQAVELLLGLYPVLFNVVDARYDASLRWLRWLGFQLGPPQGLGPDAAPFRAAMLDKRWSSIGGGSSARRSSTHKS